MGYDNKYVYKDGLDKIGEDFIARKRDKSKEMKRPEFIPII